jgi:hypothetical protein
LSMRRQYKYNHRTDNNQFERKELITRLDDNCVSTNVFLGKHPGGQISSGQLSFWANVFLGKCLSGQMLSGQMSSGQMSFWANVFLGKCCLGKCPHGQTSYGQMSWNRPSDAYYSSIYYSV